MENIQQSEWEKKINEEKLKVLKILKGLNEEKMNSIRLELENIKNSKKNEWIEIAIYAGVIGLALGWQIAVLLALINRGA